MNIDMHLEDANPMTQQRNHDRHGRRPSPWAALPLAAVLLWGNAFGAVNYQSLDEIRLTVETFLRQQYKELDQARVEVTHLDPRLKLVACEQALSAFTVGQPRGAGRLTVGVRCEGSRPWTVYVPAKLSQRVPVLTVGAALPRGTVLKQSDLVPIERDIAALPHGYFTQPEQLVGMELRRPLRAGETVTPAAVQAAALIQRGQTVLLVAEGDGISVAMRGEALADGAQGERIQVRNLSSRRVIEGEVLDGNRVKVAL